MSSQEKDVKVGQSSSELALSVDRSSFETVADRTPHRQEPSLDNDGKDDVERGTESGRVHNDMALSQASPIGAENDTQASRVSIASHRSKASQAMSKVMSKSSKSKKEHLVPTELPLSDIESGVVGWDSQDDPTMPLNFTRTRKLLIVWLLSIITLMAPLSSSIIAPAISIYSEEFGNTNSTLAAMPVSIFLLGFAVGPLYLAPMCEIHGRAIVLTCSNIFFCAWQIGCALAPNLNSLIVFRFLAGIGGSAALTLGGGVIADLFPVEERGFALSIWTIGPTLGPSLAPLIGAFIAGSIGWRWSVWIIFIPATLTTVIMAFLFPETNHRVLIDRKVRRLQKELNRPELHSCYESEELRKLTRTAILKLGLLRPLKMLFLSPIIATISLYISFVYGCIYLMYNTVPTVFQGVYGWSTGVSGLAFIALGLGYTAGLALFSIFSDRQVVHLTKKNNDVYEPEMRLPTMVYFAFVCPITFFWYGWAAQTHAHWAASVIGLFPLGVGIFGIWLPAQAYLIDAYPQYAASGIAAFTVLRSITAAFLPLAGPSLFGTLGLGWGNSLLGFICVAMVPVPVLIHRYGGYVRKRWPLNL
ncbi:major facilitator superfamily domain-containing protein [Truncatella angustata]|uniref:Major facilitator superfamily domain-containing protein n=1 Tax=Truncatella angustata TaxID=152316 RepID=A0A9P8UY95_9PEZI|nr:major facilitator superfamily domain-containing protein [Truncatella angustata]KAH6660398.1 major facilitator superfamily domain-containing protein [Truncatella angustata]